MVQLEATHAYAHASAAHAGLSPVCPYAAGCSNSVVHGVFYVSTIGTGCEDVSLLHGTVRPAALADPGIEVVPGILDPVTGRYTQGEPFVHRGFISTIAADAPARAAILYFVACFTAYVACVFCKLTGTRIGNTQRYVGYCKPVVATAGLGKGEAFQMGVDDEQRRYNSATLKQVAQTAETMRSAGLDSVGQTAMHGMSPLFKALPYLDVRTCSVVPFMHTFCQGVLKDLLRALLAKPKQPKGMAGLQLPSSRAAGAKHSSAAPQGGAAKRKKGSAAAASAAGMSGVGSQSQQQQQKQQEDLTEQQEGAGEEGGEAGDDGVVQQQPAAAAAATEEFSALAWHHRMPYVQRRVVSQRVQGFADGLHPQCNRPLRDLVKYHSSLHMDELADGIRGLFAPLLYSGTGPQGQQLCAILHHPEVKKAYGHIRRFAVFHLTEQQFSSREEYEAAVDEAHRELLEYCKLAEQVSTVRLQAAACLQPCFGSAQVNHACSYAVYLMLWSCIGNACVTAMPLHTVSPLSHL